MFPHTITIFNLTKDNENNIIYNRKIVHDVFYHVQKIISQESNGEKYTYAYDVVFSEKAIKTYLELDNYEKLEDKSNNFTLKENDIIVLNEFEEISDLSDIQKTNAQYFLIKTISDNRYGDEELQNIEVTN